MSYDQGRPSLFAGMEAGDAQASDTQRVRILSTLASSRGGARPPHKGPRNGRSLINGWTIALAMGVVTLLFSFVLIIKEQHPESIKPAKDPVAMTLPPPAVEVAEISQSSHAASTPLADMRAPLEAPTTPAAQPRDVEPQAVKVSTATAVSPAPIKQKTAVSKLAKPAPTKRHDQDVELIEAVMNHSGKHPAAH